MNNERFGQAKKVTLIAAFVSAFLGFIKLVTGLFFHSHGLIADSFHSFADIFTDLMVLFASKYGSQAADESHPYGHMRFETAATVLLAILLILTGIGIIWGGILELIKHSYQASNPWALVFAFLSIVSNEWLFRYNRKVGTEIGSELIIANAWHHRSDAASSVVVFFGLIGSILGYYYFDVLAAIVVGLLIIKMGINYGWSSIKELVDTAAQEEIIACIQKIIDEYPDVKKVHQLRTRMMAGKVFIDLHILVSPFISVSEGHFIAQQIHHNLILKLDEVQDVIVHVDPEDDDHNCPSLNLPDRNTIERDYIKKWREQNPEITSWVLHYIEGQLIIDLICSKPLSNIKIIQEDLSKVSYIKVLKLYQELEFS